MKKNFKKLVTVLVALLCAFCLALSATGCGELGFDLGGIFGDGDGSIDNSDSPQTTDGDNTDGEQNNTDDEQNNTDGEQNNADNDKESDKEETYEFSVSLCVANAENALEQFCPPETMALYAQFIGADGVYQERFDDNGIATKQLNGEYRVSIMGMPESYTYDPNGLTVDNENSHLTIELLPVATYTDNNGALGRSEYSCIRLESVGTYKVTLSSWDDIIYFEFYPPQAGTYTIESIADASADEINPKVEWTISTAAFKYNWHTPGDGEWGSVGTYTKNFNVSLSISDYDVGNVLTLALSAQHIDNLFPVEYYFKITYQGDTF